MARLIAAPFHDGRPDHDRGLGPRRIAPEATAVPAPDPDAPEAARVFAVAAGLRDAVRAARAAGELPVVLAGDCNSCVGTVAGCAGAGRLGVVWLDAHADTETPEDSAGGSLDAMGLALLLGQGWAGLRAPFGPPVDGSAVVTGGIRDATAAQLGRLEVAGATVARSPAAVLAALPELAQRVDHVYLHVDLDVLDPSEGRANAYAADDGWSAAEVLGVVDAVRSRMALAAVAVTAYDPAMDPDGRVAAVGRAVLDAVRR